MVDGSKVTGVLDFVECRVDSPIYDIAYFILELAMSYQAVRDNGLFIRCVRAFLSGICRGRHFTETEIASLPTYLRILGCRFYVFFCVERIKPLKKIVRLAERLIKEAFRNCRMLSARSMKTAERIGRGIAFSKGKVLLSIPRFYDRITRIKTWKGNRLLWN